jgi:beta-glucosidase/6-phospho-beta-glucosidase/beta-galactosidase
MCEKNKYLTLEEFKNEVVYCFYCNEIVHTTEASYCCDGCEAAQVKEWNCDNN